MGILIDKSNFKGNIMVMKVLRNKRQISNARRFMKKMNVSSIDTVIQSGLRRIGLIKDISVGDRLKSWDVLETLLFIKDHASKDKAILDIGCYASEVPIALYKMGYVNITGIDLNSELTKMPYSNQIRYMQSDFMNTGFRDESFDIVTSISVIEHGYQPKRLLKEMSRILKTDGYFIASFDYWPEKIDTSDIKFFGMDWLIFSKDDVEEFIEIASDYKLLPGGKLRYEIEKAPIKCAGKEYSFAWIMLKKSD